MYNDFNQSHTRPQNPTPKFWLDLTLIKKFSLSLKVPKQKVPRSKQGALILRDLIPQISMTIFTAGSRAVPNPKFIAAWKESPWNKSPLRENVAEGEKQVEPEKPGKVEGFSSRNLFFGQKWSRAKGTQWQTEFLSEGGAINSGERHPRGSFCLDVTASSPGADLDSATNIRPKTRSIPGLHANCTIRERHSLPLYFSSPLALSMPFFPRYPFFAKHLRDKRYASVRFLNTEKNG